MPSSLAARARRALRVHGLPTLLRYAAVEARQVAWNHLVMRSYSQHGEDRFIDALLGRKPTGFYVDIGASDPTRLNNTKRFYQRGWHGVNVEPNRRTHAKLGRARPRDTNLNVGIGPDEGVQTFFLFDPENLSTFSPEEAAHRVSLGFAPPTTHSIETLRLSSVFARYAPPEIDLLCIDTEGYEMPVLASNDWDRYRPRVICVETAPFELAASEQPRHSDAAIFLEGNGYRCVLDNGLNSIFAREDGPGVTS